jgi:cell wall-associated NlpC family hydrolase
VTHHRLADRFEAWGRRLRRPGVAVTAAAVSTVLAGGTVLLVGGGAVAAPRPTVAQAAEAVQALRDEAERSTEQFDALREQLRSLGVRLTAARARVSAQQKQVDAARNDLGRVLAETYKQGDLSGLALLLSDDPDAALERSGVLATLGERRATAVQELRDEQAGLTAAVADLTRQQQRISDTTARLQDLRGMVAGQLKAAQQRLDHLQASERAAVERLLSSGDTSITCQQTGVDTSGRVGKVLAYACAQLGDPYVWAAAGPSTFDCSGLTMQAWAAAGVSLPHNAEAQSHYGARVAPTVAALQPGDLVFYHSPISHVGIYIGHGLMIHAPHTGTVVKIARVPWGSAVAAARF